MRTLVSRGYMLRIARLAAALTQDQAAAQLNVDRSTLSRAELDHVTVLDERQAWQLYGGIPWLQKLRDAADATILRLRSYSLQPI